MISRLIIVTSFFAAMCCPFLANGAVTVFDNGGPNLVGGFGITHWKVADQFTLTSDVSANGVKFWEIEEVSMTWANSIVWEIRSNGANGLPGSILFSGTSSNLTHVATGRTFQGIPEYLITFDIPSTSLPAGIYWVVLHNGPLSFNDISLDHIFWETTTSSRTDPTYSDEAPFNNTWETNTAPSDPHPSQLAFQLSGIVRPKLISFAFVSGSPRVSFATVTGQNYRVEYKNNLNDLSWTPVSGASNISGTGGVVQINDSDPNLPNMARRHYRVTVL